MRRALLTGFLLACARTAAPLPVVPAGAEAVSLRGEPLARPSLSDEVRAERQRALDAARAAHDKDPADVDATIWLARRLGYLHRYREAVSVLTEGMARHPRDARLYRHRGHRYLTLRLFPHAVADLEHGVALRAGQPDEIEPDGLPNAAGIPTSTLHGNLWYHLALARYLMGDLTGAADGWREAMRIATTDDTRVAVAHWWYVTLRRLGRHDEAARVVAALPPAPRILDNDAYHLLVRLYRGELDAAELEARLASGDDLDRATLGYGLARWYAQAGDAARAEAKLQAILDGGGWPAFGYLAAEADRARGR